ncbi:MAG: hypothetical protein J5365_02650 [Erysipelotrichaceae bacterium]|nr:hypothetical protein [Erysipelotrichaceae bacterium]
MLKNLSDYLSLLSLILFTAISSRFFVLMATGIEKDDNSQSRLALLRDYIDNEEE